MTEEIATWFNSWERIQSVAISAAFFFIFIVALIRFLGKRATSQMNNFDWIITVAVGSLAASGILLKDVSVSDAAIAIAVIAGMQWLTTLLVLKNEWVCRLVKPNPVLLVHKGKLLTDAMRRERVTKAEVYAKLRAQGFVRVEDANWVVLETDGAMTVIPYGDAGWDDAELMEDIANPPESAHQRG